MATEVEVSTVEDISLLLIALMSKTKELNDGVEKNRLFRAIEAYNEGLRKYIRALKEPSAIVTQHPKPLCIIHGKPITWEDPECEECKKLKETVSD